MNVCFRQFCNNPLRVMRRQMVRPSWEGWGAHILVTHIGDGLWVRVNRCGNGCTQRRWALAPGFRGRFGGANRSRRGLGAIRGLHGWGWGCGNPSPYGWDLPPPARGTCPKGTSAAHRTPANPAAPTPVRNPSEGEFFPSQNRMLSRVNRD